MPCPVRFLLNTEKSSAQKLSYSAPRHRAEMVRLAIAGYSAFSLDTSELGAGAAYYTVDTLRRYQREYGCSPEQLLFVLGSDAPGCFGYLAGSLRHRPSVHPGGMQARSARGPTSVQAAGDGELEVVMCHFASGGDLPPRTDASRVRQGSSKGIMYRTRYWIISTGMDCTWKAKNAPRMLKDNDDRGIIS